MTDGGATPLFAAGAVFVVTRACTKLSGTKIVQEGDLAELTAKDARRARNKARRMIYQLMTEENDDRLAFPISSVIREFGVEYLADALIEDSLPPPPTPPDERHSEELECAARATPTRQSQLLWASVHRLRCQSKTDVVRFGKVVLDGSAGKTEGTVVLMQRFWAWKSWILFL